MREIPELRIIDEALWKKVEAIQTAVNPHREAVKRGIAKRQLTNHLRPYWLSGILVCSCGSNYISYGPTDLCCPTFTARGRCGNSLRFRRAEMETALFAMLKQHLLSDEAIAQGTAGVETWLTEQAQEEEAALREGAQSAAMRRLDEEALKVRRMDLRPEAIHAALRRDRPRPRGAA